MRVVHPDALICDFAQYYHIYDLDALDVRTAAVLMSGLPKESRLVKELTGGKPDQETLLMASILDTTRNIEYAVFQSHSKKKLKRPQSVLKKLLGIEEDSEHREDVKGFATSEEFEAARRRVVEGA